MFVLTAEGPSAGQRNSWQIGDEAKGIIGRHVRCDFPVTWDAAVSRTHAEIQTKGLSLKVECLPGSRSPLWKAGKSHFAIELADGESFRIGRTWLTVTRLGPKPVIDLLIAGTPEMGKDTSVSMSPSDIRLSAVTGNVTGLWQTTSEKELAAESLRILYDVLNGADLLAVLSCEDIATAKRPEIVCWRKTKSGAQHSVNRELISRAVGESHTAIEVESDKLGGTIRSGRWSFCVPVKSDATIPWCVYIGGEFGPKADFGPFLTTKKLEPEAGITELVAHLIGAIRSVRFLEDRFEGIRQFLSPQLQKAVVSGEATAPDLAPRETDVVAIFCDLRGFSRMVSQSSDDLHGVLQRVNDALGVITENITLQEGAIADFQGDSALGFWGWPVALTDGPIPACKAAIQIHQVFRMASSNPEDPFSKFKVGIGIASGSAIAGRIGTREHAKIGVFGPVVNIAARLEGMTKQIGASILVDEQTAIAISESLDANEARLRPVATVTPVGFDEPLKVIELLPPENASSISNADIAKTVKASAAFHDGDWQQCRELLNQLPAADAVRSFLLQQIERHDGVPPANWSGVIRLTSK